jgi:hypothetical protein
VAETKRGHTAPGYVVLHQADDGRWELVAEVERRPRQSARAARAQAIMDATRGKAKPNDAYMAVLRSEWRIASDW